MGFDPLVANPGRLCILAALAAEPRQAFVRLRRQTGLTDGNLATHGRRLESAGLVVIEKSLHQGKPLTTYCLTRLGREALTSHVDSLVAALHPPAVATPVSRPDQEDDWVD